jgi:hypothetical protein
MKNIVIFGAGDVGCQLYDIFGKDSISCYADNFPKSSTFMGLPLINFDELKKKYIQDPEMIVIVASYDFYEEIVDKMKCKPSEILFLDDNQENVDGALNVGLNAIKVNKGMDLFEEISNWLKNNE